MTRTATHIFNRLEQEARDHITASADRTDGEAEASRESLGALGKARAWWDRQGYGALTAEQLGLLERGLDPHDPYPAGGGDNRPARSRRT